ncbi:MAG: hypothetical protein OXK78_07325 [Caldilineaceae bacterium]|nr:hypothetical protein [Caldilineaceae bacterium]
MKQRKWGGCFRGATAVTRRRITALISAGRGWKMQVLMHRVTWTQELGPGSRLRRGFPPWAQGDLAVSGGRASSQNELP